MTTDYMLEVHRQFVRVYGIEPTNPASMYPRFPEGAIEDGEYPMDINGMTDYVRVKNGRISCCHFKPGASLAFEDGRKAGREGKPITECPFRTPRWRMVWKTGWEKGHRAKVVYEAQCQPRKRVCNICGKKSVWVARGRRPSQDEYLCAKHARPDLKHFRRIGVPLMERVGEKAKATV